ncbi:DUF6350 family protein [uncultured Bifidobacterium sp.]|uniref:cell division protein PerM n=1 Tax=uncultured Bifidobacterium sp. TaxID=165187 RepID=UPI0028DCC0F3|nr:DUF6350 family protein [uncultured Bifidobacterium sp.]
MKPAAVGRLRGTLAGGAVALLSLTVSSLGVGLLLALTLLVISMEEGGDNLSQFSVSLTEAAMLLAQGVGFRWGVVTLTLIPLLLTSLLIALVMTLAQRLSTSASGFIAGLTVWLVVNAVFTQGVQVVLLDPLWLVLVKTGSVFTVGYALAAMPASPIMTRVRGTWRDRLPPEITRMLGIGFRLAATLVIASLGIGCLVVIAWTMMDWRAMLAVFDMTGMGTGSRILTTVCTLAWLPNLCLWAASWVFGSGFSIGALATFTMWTGQSAELPAIPVLGLLPGQVEFSTLRTCLLLLPGAISMVLMLAAMLSNRGFAVRPTRIGDGSDPRAFVRDLLRLAYPAGSALLAVILLSASASGLFALSNGSLGVNRLRNLGVSVSDATRAVVRPAVLGLLSGWLFVVIAAAGVFAIRWIRSSLQRRREAPTEGTGESDATLAGTPPPRIVTSGQQSKEDNDDNIEPTDTTGSGIRLS